MNPLNFLAGGAILGVIAGLWDKIKAVAWKVISLFIQRIELPCSHAHSALIAYLVKHHGRSPLYDRMYGAAYAQFRDGRYGLVPYEMFGNRAIVFWEGWWPFVFCNAIENKGGNGNGQPQETTKVFSTITSIRWTIDVEAILVRACAGLNEQTWTANDTSEKARNRFAIHYVPEREDQDAEGYRHHDSGLAWYQHSNYRLLGRTPEELGKPRNPNGKALDNLILPRRVTDLVREIEVWRSHKEWYQKKCIPWKRGWLLYGPPGTGKTALARAFAEDLNMPIYVYNLAEVGNYEFIRAWTEMQVNVPCIALTEDIDNVFHGRENVARKASMFSMFLPKKKDDNENKTTSLSPLSFDCLLNCLDGVDRAEGVFTIITTNDISKIDSALGLPRATTEGGTDFISTRPGRIDKAIELSYMDLADKKRMARRILSDYPDELTAMLEFVDQYPDLKETPAQFQERCGQVALACLWEDERKAKEARVVRRSGDTWSDLRTPIPEEALNI
jgi:hypothetical protein